MSYQQQKQQLINELSKGIQDETEAINYYRNLWSFLGRMALPAPPPKMDALSLAFRQRVQREIDELRRKASTIGNEEERHRWELQEIKRRIESLPSG